MIVYILVQKRIFSRAIYKELSIDVKEIAQLQLIKEYINK